MAVGNEAAPGDEPPAEEPSKKYDQDFFLALAAKGKEAWNAWRRDPANEKVRVTFAGTDFSVAPSDVINFSGFEFGIDANFSQCKWRGAEREGNLRSGFDEFTQGRAFFTGALFGGNTNFTDAVFGGSAFFYRVAFGGSVNFTNATFGWGAVFEHAAFKIAATFDGAVFDENADFYGASFQIDTSFAR